MQNSQENASARVSILIKLHASPVPDSLFEYSCRPQTCNFIKKKNLAEVFSCEFSAIFKRPSFYNTSGGCFWIVLHNSSHLFHSYTKYFSCKKNWVKNFLHNTLQLFRKYREGLIVAFLTFLGASESDLNKIGSLKAPFIKTVTYVMLYAICYSLHDFKKGKNTHGGILLLIKLQVLVCMTF